MNADWFKNEKWSDTIELEFLNNLKSLKPVEEQAPHLRVQGDAWLRSRDQATKQAGVKMLQKLIDDYSKDIWEVPIAQDLLGHHYYQQGDFEQALPYLEAALRFYREHKRVGVIRIADLLLAEIILLRRQSDKMEYALQLVLDYPKTGVGRPV
jgi:tetratricopeptide (TPR) repeat protein